MIWVRERLREYAKGKRTLEKYRASLIKPENEQSEDEQTEIELVSSMISDMNYAMDWMRTGRKPYSRRGIDIHDAYSRAMLMDMDLIPAAKPDPPVYVSVEQKKELVQILMTLSARELQCYLLHMAQGLSYAEIGRELKLTKRTVQYYVDKARAKVGQAV